MRALATLIVAAFAVTVVKADTAKTITLLSPLDGATVREVVPIRVSPADMPAGGDGYFTVSIDKVFRTAKIIDPGKSLLYTWDSQAAYQDQSNPGVDKFTDDGSHEIEVAIYTHTGSLLASGASTVTLANKVTNLPDGVSLTYAWSEDETLRYKQHSEINMLSADGSVPAVTTQSADIRFDRSVEDSSGGGYLVRDLVIGDDSTLLNNGVSTPVDSMFLPKSRYRTVNHFGGLMQEEAPFSTGDHFGFPIPQLPNRRITASDSWPTRIEVSVPWATTKPTVVHGTGRLDSFEWQDGYPTAKIIETYNGPAKFYADPRGQVPFQADTVQLTRTYWFAYNSKKLVRIKTDMTVEANVGTDVTGLLGTSPTATPGMGGGNPYGGQGGSPYGGGGSNQYGGRQGGGGQMQPMPPNGGAEIVGGNSP
jgi:hypothetical protein